MALDAGSVEATLVLDLDDRGFRDGDRKMAEWARKDSSAQLSFDVEDRGFDAADRKLHEWGMKSSTAELKFDVDRASLGRLIAGAGGAGKAISGVTAAAGEADGNLRSFGGTMQGLQWAGIIVGALPAAAALLNVGGAAISVGSALSSLSGLLVAVPQGFTAFAQGAGTVTAATSGISDALKAYTTQQQQAGKVEQQTAGRQLSAAETRKSAAQQVTSAQQQQADASRQVGAAERNLTVQHEATTQAQHALNLAIEQAKRDMQDLQRQAVESSTAEKMAGYNLAEARRAYNRALADPTTSQLHLAELQTGVVAARQAQTDAHITATRAQQDNNRAQREGVQGQPNVVAAHQAVTQAVRAEADAHRQLEDAQRGLTRATQNLDYQQKQAKLHIDQSNQSMQTATTTANVYQQALQNLAPAQRQFVRFLVNIEDRFQGLRQVAAKNLFPGVEQGITSALKNFPRLRSIVAETGRVLGRVAEQVGKFLGSKQFGRDMSLFARTNLKLFRDLGGAGIHFAHGLEIIMRDAQPFLRWLGGLARHLGTTFDQFARSGHQTGVFRAFFHETERTLPQVLHLLKNFSSLLVGIGEAAAPSGNSILGFFNRTLRSAAQWSHSIEGQLSLRSFFDRMKKPFEDLLKLLGAIGAGLVQVFGSDQGQRMLDEITKALIKAIPPLTRLLAALSKLVEILAPSLIELLTSFVQVLVDAAPALDVLAKGLAAFADGLKWLLDNVPGLKSVAGNIVAIGLAIAGVKWAYGASGLGDLKKGLESVFGAGGVIEKGPAKVNAFFDAVSGFPSNLKKRTGSIFSSVKNTFSTLGSRIGQMLGLKVAEDTVGGEAAGQAGGGLIGKMKSLGGRMRTRLGSIFKSLGSFLGLRVGEQVAVTTVEGAAAGEVGGVAGGGIIGRMKGLMSKLRGRLGTMFKALGSFLGIRIGEQVAVTTVEGAAAGEAGGGIIGGLRSRLPRLTSFLGGLGSTLGIAFGTALAAAALYEFGKKFDTGLPGILGLAFPDKTGSTSSESASQALSAKGFTFRGQTPAIPDPNHVEITVRGHTLRIPISKIGNFPDLTTLTQDPGHRKLLQQLIRKYGTGGQQGGLVSEQGIVGFAGGGVAGAGFQRPGPTDTVPAMLTPGEIVLPKKASQAIQNAVGPITAGTEKATKAILKLIRRDVSDSYAGLLSDVSDVEDKLTKRNRATWQQVHKDADDEIGQRQGQSGTFWGDVYDAITGVGDSWDQITQKMVDQTQGRFGTIAQTAQRQGKNFSGYVKDAMREASDATYTGTSYIAQAVTKSLKAFDSKSKFHLTVDKPNLQTHAQGGMIGGQGRSDTVPLLLGMAAPGEAILTRYQQGWVEAALRNTFGMGLGDLFSRETRPHGFAKGGQIGNKSNYVYPFPKGTTLGRTDQGVDLGGVGTPVGAIGEGVVTSLSDYFAGSGYPAAGGLVYRLVGGAPKGYSPSSPYIYTFEGLNRRGGIGMGSKLNAGQVFGSIGFQGDTSIEMGWAASGGGQPLAQTSGGPIDPVSHFSPAGASFTRFLNDLASGKAISGGAAMAQLLGKMSVKGTAGPILDLVQAALDMERGAGNTFLSRHERTVTGPSGFSVPMAKGSLARRAATIARKLKAPHRAALSLFEALWAESGMGTTSSNVLQLIPQTAASAGIGLTDADAQISSFLENAYGFGPGAIQLAKTTSEPAYAIAQDIQGSGAGQASGGLSNYGAQAARATSSLHQLGYPTFREGGYIGRLESRLRHLTRVPAIRQAEGRIRSIAAEIRRQAHRLKNLSKPALHGHRGAAIRDAINKAQRHERQLHANLAAFHKQARAAVPQIQHLDARLAGRLLPMFSHAEHVAEMGGDPSGLLRSLHVGRAIGSPALRSFAHSRTASIRNALAISRAQGSSLGGGSIFAQGGFLGSGLGLTNVSGGSQQAPIYLMLDADVAGFVGRVRAVQDGREVELARKVGLSRLTPGSIGRKAVYRTP